ncbi:hypothetical protein LCGC14_2540810 [marine sediment metagenome]|uniref:Uncharacterized protein n=1 Tax=marine sediment metagenome TaxID=412755 RepID=A0A0F9AQT1_9ZZZZ
MKLFDEVLKEVDSGRPCSKCGSYSMPVRHYEAADRGQPTKIVWVCGCGYDRDSHTRDYKAEEKPPDSPVGCLGCANPVDGYYLTVCKSCGDKAVDRCFRKPSEPKCKHGNELYAGPIGAILLYKDMDYKYCKDCGERLG